MDVFELMEKRHSVRSFLEKPINEEDLQSLTKAVESVNGQSGLNVQLVVNEPQAFSGFMAHYGKFYGVKNYIALVGKRGEDEKIGYYGEKLVLLAQSLGLNSCWVALTYKKVKTAFNVNAGEKLYCVIALGYGVTQGVAHKSKPFKSICRTKNPPEWFIRGVNAALLAPTAVNQQKFTFALEGDNVIAKSGVGFYSKIDLGIVKYHFDLAVGKTNLE